MTTTARRAWRWRRRTSSEEYGSTGVRNCAREAAEEAAPRAFVFRGCGIGAQPWPRRTLRRTGFADTPLARLREGCAPVRAGTAAAGAVSGRRRPGAVGLRGLQ